MKKINVLLVMFIGLVLFSGCFQGAIEAISIGQPQEEFIESVEENEVVQEENTTETVEVMDDEESVEDGEIVGEPEERELEEMDPQIIQIAEREWSILIYMAADNNLESAAIEDLCEIESAKFNVEKITVLALVDRNPGYNSTNSNWSGTRMYKVSSGKNKSKQIQSEEINCINLGLKPGINTELDMSSEFVLSEALSFLISDYPAEKYGLIIWGHGTGWRSENNPGESNGFKGVAYDETSGTYMTLGQMKRAIDSGSSGNKIDFIGLDTCYGGELEVAYELRDSGKFLVGSEGLIGFSGWDYNSLFNQLGNKNIIPPNEMCFEVVNQFRDVYEYTSRASICAVDLSEISEYQSIFNKICSLSANQISTLKKHDEVMNLLYSGNNCPTEKYTYGQSGYDIYLDTSSMLTNLCDYFSSIKEIKNAYDDFIRIKRKAIIDSWASDREEGGLGVFFSTLSEGGFLSSTHPAAYINGRTLNQIDFVRDSTGYVVSSKTGKSLLDKLFYTQF